MKKLMNLITWYVNYLIYVEKSDKMQYEKINQIKDIGIESAEIEMANREITQQNDLMKRDMIRCQEHLENLLKQNLYLQQSMDNYVR